MEQSTNSRLAGDDCPDAPLPPDEQGPDPRIAPIPVPRPSCLLTDDAAAAISPIRIDGWTAERMRIFLSVLSRCGSVSEAARNAGLSRQSAYALRNSERGRAFDLAWNAAHILAHRRLADDLLERAVHGQLELYVREGKVVGERHRFDTRLALSMLGRLDNRLGQVGPAGENARLGATEFEALLDLVCDGGEGLAEFLAERRADRKHWRGGREAALFNSGAAAGAANRAAQGKSRARTRGHCQSASTCSGGGTES